MRIAPILLVLLTGCGGSFILKQPVVDQCQSQGLQGCDEITEGVLAYVDGDTVKGRAKLVAGAAKNSPDKVKQFAAGLSALRELPGMSDQLGPIGEVASILSGDASSLAATNTSTSSAVPASVELQAAVKGGSRPKLFAETTSTDDQRQVGCKDGSSSALCTQVHAGGIVVTDIVFEGKCDGAFVGAFPRGVWVTSSARWTLRRQVSAGAWNVEPDEIFAVGGPDGARCDVSWAARTR
jgi:hypothetical protein